MHKLLGKKFASVTKKKNLKVTFNHRQMSWEGRYFLLLFFLLPPPLAQC